MKCDYCGCEIDDGRTIIPVTPDGDFVCSMECKGMWERKRDQLFNEILPDSDRFHEWLTGKPRED